MRTIRLVRLIAYYETQEYELIRHESRSITRSLSSPKEQTFKTERIILWFLNKRNLPILRKDREAFGKSYLRKSRSYIMINTRTSFYASLISQHGWNRKSGKKSFPRC